MWSRRISTIAAIIVIALILAIVYILSSALYAEALQVYWVKTGSQGECLYMWRGYTGYWHPTLWPKVYMCAVIR